MMPPHCGGERNRPARHPASAKGVPPVHTLVLYDVASDRLRNKVAQACSDYGLLRVQYSAFLGDINANRRAEFAVRVKRLLGKADAEVRVVCLCDKDVKLMQTLGARRAPEDEPDAERARRRRPTTVTRSVKRVRRGAFVFASAAEVLQGGGGADGGQP